MILFTQPCLQFWFFLNLFSCLLTTSLSRRNNRSCAGLPTLFNFQRNANNSESPLHSTSICTILLPPEMFTQPRQDVNDSLFILRLSCNTIRVCTPPDYYHTIPITIIANVYVTLVSSFLLLLSSLQCALLSFVSI